MTERVNAGEVKFKKPMSGGKKMALGCLGVLMIGAVLIGGGAWYVYSQFTALYKPYADAGYTVVFEQMVAVSKTIAEPTVYVVQDVDIDADSDGGLAFVSETVQIKGEIRGDVDLILVQKFTLESGARIVGDLNVKVGQIIILESGSVVTGDVHTEAVETLKIEDGAVVGGTVTGSTENLEQAPGALIGGEGGADGAGEDDG